MQKLMSLTVALVMLLVLLLPVSATEYATITCGEAFTMEGVDGKRIISLLLRPMAGIASGLRVPRMRITITM